MLSDMSIKRDEPDSIFRRLLLSMRRRVSVNYRNKLNVEIQKELTDVPAFTIFSNNCLGGVFYHDAGLEFTSPLINTAMDGDDFLKFLNNPQYYLSCDFEFFEWPGRDFPIARLDDIEINFVHYKTADECVNKWNERKKRIHWENVYIIATNHDGMYKESCMKRFDELPYKNKIMFVSKEYPEYDWAILIPQFKNRYQCRVTTAFADMKGHRYYETAFDLAKWISERSRRM